MRNSKNDFPVKLDDEAIGNGCKNLIPLFETSVYDIVRTYELLRK